MRLETSSRQLLVLFLALIGIIAIASLVTPGFLTYSHLTMVLYCNTFLGILALAQTLIILSGGLDLSIGAIY